MNWFRFCVEFGKYDKREQLENAGRLAHDMIGNLNHGMSEFYYWNILLDENGGPNHAKNYCDAPFLFDMEKKELEQRLSLRCYWHFAHFIKPGAVRLATIKYTDGLDFTAWENTDGRICFILLNRQGRRMSCNIRIDGMVIKTEAFEHSLISGEFLLS